MVKLSRTTLTFFSLAGLAGAVAFGEVRGFVTGLATGFAAGFTAGLAAVLVVVGLIDFSALAGVGVAGFFAVVRRTVAVLRVEEVAVMEFFGFS